MIDNNVDQDEWFNLYLCLGSCWVNKSRYETRYDTRYDTWHKVRTWTKKSLDQLIELKLRISRWTQGVSTRKSSWNPDVWGPGTSTSTRSTCTVSHGGQEPGSVVCSLRTNEPGFSKSIFSSQITGNEVLILFNFVSKIGHLED
jgi:hypothetical protein